MDLTAIERAVVELLGEEPLVAVYLVGSLARGDDQPASDVDVAVLFGGSLGADERLARGLRYAGLLETALQRAVDVVALDDAPLRLVASVLRERRILLSLDEAARVAYEARTAPVALDFQLHAEREDRAVLRLVATEGLA